MPIEPPSSRWALPARGDLVEADELVAVGADLEPGTLLAAYRSGLFPMPLSSNSPAESDMGSIGWWSPDPRGVIPLDGFHCSRSLTRARKRFEIRVDTAFADVIRGCADPQRPHGWIDDKIVSAYTRLHEMGWAHSIEAWDKADGVLAGGLYGLAIGRLFAAESMFHVRTNGSKVAVAGLIEILATNGFTLLDVQWTTPHLTTLGAIDVSRRKYLDMCTEAVAAPNSWASPRRSPG